MSNFVSVSTMAARVQGLGTNPLKLAGQCAKIKCCVNFEAPMYIDVQKDFPSKDTHLETLEGTFYLFKADTFKRQLTYSSSPTTLSNLTTISVERANEIIAINRKGGKVDKLIVDENNASESMPAEYQNVVGQDSLTRFDKSKGERRNRNNRNGGDGRRQGNQENRNSQGNGDTRNSETNQENRENRERKNGNRPRRDNRPRQDKPSNDKK